jgi:hypothetical protein
MRDYMKRSRVIKSDLTGKDKTVWDEEIDAEYASDSSTEEVHLRLSVNSCVVWKSWLTIFASVELDNKSSWKCSRLLVR